jgi:hypothetical protein
MDRLRAISNEVFEMDEIPCMDIPVEELGLSEECLINSKRVGITVIGDLVEVLLQRNPGALITIRSGFVRCFETEIITKLKQKGCWLDELDTYLENLD